MNVFFKTICLSAAVIICACSSSYKYVEVVSNFSKGKYLAKAKELGFDVSKLIWVEHNK